MAMRSFRGRLTVALAASTGIFLTLFCLFLYFWCRSAFLADLDGDLRAIASAELTAGADIDHRLDISSQSHGDSPFRLLGLLAEPGGRVLKATDSELGALPQIAEMLAEAPPSQSRVTSLRIAEEDYRALVSSVWLDGRELIEILAISQAPVEHSLKELREVLALALGLGIVLLSVTSNLVARYLTGPLEHMLEHLKAVTSRGDPSARLVGVYQDREIAVLQDEINAMLGRLDRSFQAQRRLVSDASHELRAPLSNLSLAMEVCLRRERNAAEYREALVTCRGETERLTQMCQGLLTLSQCDEEGLQLQRQPTDLLRMLRSCQERMLGSADQRDVKLVLRGDSVEADVDPAMLERVVENFLSNALRYSPRGSTVEMVCRRDDSGAEIWVKDMGPGLQPHQRELVFERFYRSDESRQRVTGGAGLGLSIAREIVKAHGGEIGVESTLGQGCRFWLSLPLIPTHSPNRAPS